jgi:hypothetical protein
MSITSMRLTPTFTTFSSLPQTSNSYLIGLIFNISVKLSTANPRRFTCGRASVGHYDGCVAYPMLDDLQLRNPHRMSQLVRHAQHVSLVEF